MIQYTSNRALKYWGWDVEVNFKNLNAFLPDIFLNDLQASLKIMASTVFYKILEGKEKECFCLKSLQYVYTN